MKATFFTAPEYLGNRQFAESDPCLNRDGCLSPFIALRGELAQAGISLDTQDITPASDARFAIYNDMPPRRAVVGSRKYLLLLESEVIRPDNWDLSRHAYFDAVFTWRDDLVDGKRYVKINFTADLSAPPPDERPRGRFCAVIAGNKSARHPLELYSKRIEAVRWFEKHHPGELDLYGPNWDKQPSLKDYVKFAVGKGPFPRRRAPFTSYRGTAADKTATLRNYRFSICFENARDIPGYITEKILECFHAGCVPVYWGAPNIADHIPEAAFIDFRRFNSYESLYRHLSAMSPETYAAHQAAAREFLSSPRADPFRPEHFARTILDRILSDVG